MIDENESTTLAVHSAPNLAGALAVLANPVRLRIVSALAGRREYVSELARRLQIARPLLHMHLRRLEEAGLVRSAMEISPLGKAMRFYEVAPFDLRLTPETLAEAAGIATAESEPSIESGTTAEAGDA